MDRPTAIKKIRKLLLKAADKRAPEPERKTSRLIANKLMAEHKISEMEVWASTKADDLPPDLQTEFIDDIYSKLHEIIGSVEDKKDEAYEKMLGKAEKFVEDNKAKMKESFGNWLDGLFK